MSQPRKLQTLSEAEYLAFEESAAVRHEYVDGQVFAMAGAGVRHIRIVTNLAFHLRGPARGGPCGVYVNGMKLRLEWRRSFYPRLSIRRNRTRHAVRGELVEPRTALRQAQGERFWG